MNDDVKAAVEAAHARITAIEAKSGGEPDLRIGLWALEKVIDGEDARTAAAVAAKAEEVRASCAQAAAHWVRESGLSYGEPSHLFDAVMAVPLDSTPLADEMRDEREVSQSLREQLIAAEGANRYLTERLDAAGDLLAQLEKAEARVSELEAEVSRRAPPSLEAEAVNALKAMFADACDCGPYVECRPCTLGREVLAKTERR